jgi:hypothetical protein
MYSVRRSPPTPALSAGCRITRPGLEALEDRTLPSFAPPVFYPAGPGPFEVLTKDLRGNGHLDLIDTNRTSNEISVLLGDGRGGFAPPVSYSTGPGSAPEGFVIGDVNGDGIPDIVTANAGTNNISVLLGNGDGTFQPPVQYSTGGHTDSVAIGDFTGTGKADLVVTNNFSNTISVLLNHGDGTFAPAVDYATGGGPDDVVPVDLTGTGRIDLIVCNTYSDTLQVFRGNGDGTFQATASYHTGNFPISPVLADLNGDGILDLAVGNYGGGSVNVLLGNRDGTFRDAISSPAGISNATTIQAGDFDRTGRIDLVVGSLYNGRLSLLRGNGDGTFQSPEQLESGTGGNNMVVGDFNGDGLPDLASVTPSGSTVAVSLNQSNQAIAFQITGPRETTAGQAWSFTVDAVGSGGVIDPSYRGTVHFTSTDPFADLPDDYTFTDADAGQHTFTATPRSAGTWVLTATDTVTGITGTTGDITVSPAAFAGFVIAGLPDPYRAGSPNPFTVTAVDAFGNVITDYRGTVHFTSSDHQAYLPLDYTFTDQDAGTHTFALVLLTPGTQTVTVWDILDPSKQGSAEVDVVSG